MATQFLQQCLSCIIFGIVINVLIVGCSQKPTPTVSNSTLSRNAIESALQKLDANSTRPEDYAEAEAFITAHATTLAPQLMQELVLAEKENNSERLFRALSACRIAGPNVEPVVPLISELLLTGKLNEMAARQAADALAAHNSKGVRPLADVLVASQPHIRHAAMSALVKLGVKASPAIPNLIIRLHNSDENIRNRTYATYALGVIGRESPDIVIPELKRILSDKTVPLPLHYNALRALKAFGKWATQAESLAKDFLTHPDEDLRKAAEELISEISKHKQLE